MRVRWSQLAYRLPGSDNELGLAKIYYSSQGYSVRFSEQEGRFDEKEAGYLAIVPVAQAIEQELDEWVDVQTESFVRRDEDLWGRYNSTSPEKRTLRQLAMLIWGHCLTFARIR